MTKEKLNEIKNLEYLINNTKYFFTNGEINHDSINYLYRQDDEFHEDITKLRDKYWKKYNDLFDKA